MAKIELICPQCNKYGKIEVEDTDKLKKNRRGIMAINVEESTICTHSFVAYIDKNLNVRDCFVCDFKIELPEIQPQDITPREKIKDIDEIKLDLILLNIKALELVYILNGVLMKRRVLLINDVEVIHDHLVKMIEFLFQGNFTYNFSILTRLEYKNNKSQYKHHEIIDTTKNLSRKKKELKSKTIKIESSIVEKFLSEQDSYSGLLLFRNEINKAFRMSKTIINILQNYQKEQKLSKKKVVDLLSKRYNIKIQFEYLEFLLDIVENYHEYDLSDLSEYYFPNLGL